MEGLNELNKEQRAERLRTAWEMRLKGRSYLQIGKQLGCSKYTAKRYVEAVWEEEIHPTAEKVRAMEFARLLTYLDKLDHKIECADVAAIALAVRISERLCRMTGADVPVTQSIQVEQTNSAELEVVQLIREVQARNQATLERVSRPAVAAIEGEAVQEAEVVE